MKTFYHHFSSLPSTNTWSKKHLSHFPRNALTIVTAEGQTAGYGQQGRCWFSPPSVNLYGSFCFFLHNSSLDLVQLTQLMAHSLIPVLEDMGIPGIIKWPNDILVNRKKIAGILTETVPFSDYTGIIIGVGLNVNMPLSSLKKISQPATSLYLTTKKLWNIADILHSLEKVFLKNLKDF